MWQKCLLLGLALSFTAAANAKLCCGVTVDGQALEGRYSLGAVLDGSLAAQRAADEILAGDAVRPRLRRHYRLSFSPPQGSGAELSDALLRHYEGVAVTDGVYVDGERLGAVTDGDELRARLESFILRQLPSWAVAGEISGKLELQRQYSRADRVTDTEDMLLLISGVAPVNYTDGKGYTSWA